jgi:hypothetical protein
MQYRLEYNTGGSIVHCQEYDLLNSMMTYVRRNKDSFKWFKRYVKEGKEWVEFTTVGNQVFSMNDLLSMLSTMQQFTNSDKAKLLLEFESGLIDFMSAYKVISGSFDNDFRKSLDRLLYLYSRMVKIVKSR